MKHLQKILTMLLAAVLILSVVLVPANAASGYGYIQYKAADTPVFQDDFADGLGNWSTKGAVLTNGQLQLGTENVDGCNAYANLTTGYDWTDFVLEFEADFNQRFYRGISFRRQSNGNHYLWWFGADGVQIVKRISGGWTVATTTGAPVALSGVHDFKLVVKGNRIETYVDGALYNSLTDSTLQKGSIGFLVDSDLAWFDNVRVTPIEDRDDVITTGNAILTEDFSDGLTGWTTALGSAVNGQLQLGTPTSQIITATATPSVYSAWTDYVLEFDADFGGQSYRGISFRRQANGDDYLWWFGDGNFGTQVVKRVRGGWEPIGDNKPAMGLSGTHHFKIVVQGSQFKTYVDGSLCNTVTDSTLTSGGILFFVNYGAAWFDNVVVKPIEEQSADGSVVRVAMASADITPDKPVYLQGYQGQSDLTLATPERVTSDLKARILIIDNGKDRLVFVNLEMISSGAEYGDHNLSVNAVDAIAQICQTEQANVLLSNTHNHQSYMRLSQREENHIIKAVEEAYARLAPAKVGVAQVNTQYGSSRAGNYTVDVNKPYDSLMNVIRFDNAETGAPIGLIYSVPMHNTMLGNGYENNINKLNCEFTGYASRAIEAQMAAQNPYFTAMHINGFYGNATAYANGTYHASTVAKLKSYGEAFATEILAGFNSIQTETMTGDIKTGMVDEWIPAHKTNKEYSTLFGALDEMPLKITLGAMGDIGYVGVNYEPYSIIGARLKAESPYKALLLAGDVNGWKGYIPTKEAVALHESGDYQAECTPEKSPFDADAEEVFYAKVLTAVNDMAEVDMIRVPMTSAGVQYKNSAAEYTFTLSEQTRMDKLVISFGQSARTDCAENFDVIAYNAAGQQVWSKTYTGNSVNYLGEFLNGTGVSSVVLRVRTRYNNGTSGITTMSPQVWGIQFEDVLELGQQLYTESEFANLNGWTGTHAVATNGRLELGTFGGGDMNSYATPNVGNTWTDYVLEFDADFDSRPYRGISFRRQDNGDDYLWWFGDSNLGLQIVKRIDGGWEPIGDNKPSLALTGTHHFKLVVNGSKLRTYIDGVLYNTAIDSTLTTGGFLFLTSTSGAWFDNIVVTAIGGNVSCTHATTVTSVQAATCTVEGSRTVSCADCGKVILREAIPAGHNYSETVTAPTCGAAGYTMHTCVLCGHSYQTDEVPATGEHTYAPVSAANAAATCSVCGKEVFAWAGMSVSLESSLQATFVVQTSKLPESGYYAVVEKEVYDKDTGEISIETTRFEAADFVDYNTSGTMKKIVYSGIAAKQMTDRFTVTIYNEAGEQISASYTRTIEEYILDLLSKTGTKAATKVVCVDFLNYGAAAQDKFGYRTTELANRGLTTAQKALATADTAIANVSDDRVKGALLQGTAVAAEYEIVPAFVYQSAKIANVAKAKISYVNFKGETVSCEIAAADFANYNTSGSMKKLEIKGAAVADGASPITVKLIDGNGKVVDETTECVNYYCARMAADHAVFTQLLKVIYSAKIAFA